MYRFICVKNVRVNFIIYKINLGGNAEHFVLFMDEMLFCYIKFKYKKGVQNWKKY